MKLYWKLMILVTKFSEFNFLFVERVERGGQAAKFRCALSATNWDPHIMRVLPCGGILRHDLGVSSWMRFLCCCMCSYLGIARFCRGNESQTSPDILDARAWYWLNNPNACPPLSRNTFTNSLFFLSASQSMTLCPLKMHCTPGGAQQNESK